MTPKKSQIYSRVEKDHEQLLSKFIDSYPAPFKTVISGSNGALKIRKGFFRSNDCSFDFNSNIESVKKSGFDHIVLIISGIIPNSAEKMNRISFYKIDDSMKKSGEVYTFTFLEESSGWEYGNTPEFEIRINPIMLLAETDIMQIN